MERGPSRPIVALAGCALWLIVGVGLAADSARPPLHLPELAAAPVPGTSSISVSVGRLRPADRIELTLPAGLGEANGLEHEWTRSQGATLDATERWVLRASNAGSTSLTLDVSGLAPGDRGVLSSFATDPETGDELQANWWLVAGADGARVIPAGAARLQKMIRLTLAPGAEERWATVLRDEQGRLLLRQSDPRLPAILPWTVRQEPFIQASSLSAELASGQVSTSTTYDVVFTNYVCESWIGLILQVTSAPSDAVITTFDVSYTVYHSVDTSRYKSSVARSLGSLWLSTVSLYNGTYSGHNWHTRSLTGLPDWAGFPVNFDYVLGVCNLYGAEYAYLDQWTITLYYNTGGGGTGTVDLVADSVDSDFDTVAVGGQLGYYYEAHVGGSGSVGSAFSTGVYLSSDAGISTSDTLLQTVPESSTLSAGDQFGARIFSRQVNIPASVAPGTYWVGVLLDNGGAVSETNEGNNTAAHQITVVGSSSKPNLKVTGCSVTPDHASSSDSVQLSYRAQNTGATGAAYFSWGTFVSADQTFDGSDQLISGLDVPGGWAAGYDSGTQSVTVPLSGLSDGVYYLGFMADVGNQVPETSEADNYCVAQITIGSGGGGGGVTNWLIAAVASLTGLNHANWKTQVSVVNPDSSTHTVNVYYVAKGASWPGVLLAGPISLSPNQGWFMDDPLSGLRPTSGMMYVVADSPGPVVTTRTYNDVTGVGRYGQGIAAEPIGSSCASELILPMVHSGPGQYHTNLGLVQASSGSFTVEVSIYSSGGTLLATKSYTRSGAFDQITDIFADMGLGSTVINGAWIRVRLTSGCPTHWTTYASVIDESTGDPTYVAPVAP
ncbi:MAG: hypothetical protein LJE95_11925 [Acidobacteria bacterium]|nr:hypothetical protein [Acidobacteriota bacterium]